MKINKKLKNLTDREMQKLSKMLGECEIKTFDTKEMGKRIEASYKLRTKAHELMLEADRLLDGIIKEVI